MIVPRSRTRVFGMARVLLFGGLLAAVPWPMVWAEGALDVELPPVVAAAETEGEIDNVHASMSALTSSLAEKMGARPGAAVSFPVDETPLANLHYMKGAGFRCSGDLGQALTELTIACRYAPSHERARSMLATLYRDLGFDEHSRIVLTNGKRKGEDGNP